MPPQLTPRFRLAVPVDFDAIVQLRARASSASPGIPFISAAAGDQLEASLSECILDRGVLLGIRNGRPCFAAALNLDGGMVSDLCFDDRQFCEQLFSRAIAGVERLAVSFGILELSLAIAPSAEAPFLSHGYRAKSPRRELTAPVANGPASLHRSLRRRLDRYGRLILGFFDELGIPADYGARHRLARQPEARNLRSIGKDIHGREQLMSRRAGAAWERMRQRALRDDIDLQAVSAFRSAAYQAELLRRKLARGLSMEAILRVSAAPGYSEHHSGRAIDITTPGYTALEEEFESSPAFQWLESHAAKLGFRLSFPRVNRHQLAFEPWHWYYYPGRN